MAKGPLLQSEPTTKPSLRSYTRRIIRAKRAFATSSDKVPTNDEINVPGTHPTAGRAGIDAEIWKTYVSEASDYDKNLIASWNEDLDVLLIFAGLFSAVLTAFIIESRKDLEEDFQKTSANLLRILIAQSSNTTVATIPPFQVASSAIRVNVLWFASLACSLISALGAMLGKQWVRHYTNHLFGGGAHLLRARRHQAALLAAQQWRMSGVIMTIPILMHLSLFLFFIGLSIFLSGDNVIIVRTIMVISLMGVLLYAIITILPSLYQHCPFGTPLSRFLPPFYPTLTEHQDNEQHSASDLDAKCLTWLMTYTTSTRIAHSAAASVSGLACTPSQQDILYTGGGVNVLTKALASCAVEENGSLTIRRESLDTASLLLFGAQSLLNISGPRLAPDDDHENLNKLLKKFDSNKFLDIRSNFDAADSAAAMWCILSHRSLNLQDPSDSNELVNRLRKIPSSFEIPAANRAYKELLTPCIHLVLSTQNDSVLCSWAVERMFNSWEFEGRPSLGKTGAQILSKALMGALQTVTSYHRINDIVSFGGVEPIILALSSWKGNTDAQGRVADILDRISSFDPNIDAISNAVGLLIQAFSSLEGNTNVQMALANTLDKISSRDHGIDDISGAGFGALIRALTLLDGSVQEKIVKTLVNISSSDHGVNAIVSGAGVGPLVQSLTSLSAPNAQNDVITTLARISSSDCGVNAIISAGVGPLLQALTSQSNATRGHLAKILSQITSSKRGINAISGEDVGPLVRALEWNHSNYWNSSNYVNRSNSWNDVVETIAQISTCDCGVNAIIASAGIDPLVQALLLSGGSSDQERITGILDRILSSNHNVDAIISSKNVDQLVQGLLSSQSTCREDILKKLAQISSSDSCVDAIISSGGVKSLMKISNLDSCWHRRYDFGWHSRTRALALLARISFSNHGIDAIVSNKGVGTLVQALASGRYRDDWDYVAEMLARISSSNRGINAIIFSGGVEPLIRTLKSPNYSTATKYHAAETLAQILYTDRGIRNTMSFRRSGIDALISGVEPLIKALGSNEHAIQAGSIILLCHIAAEIRRRDALQRSKRAELLDFKPALLQETSGG